MAQFYFTLVNTIWFGYRDYGWRNAGPIDFFKKIYYNNYRKIKKGVFLMTLEVLKALAVILEFYLN